MPPLPCAAAVVWQTDFSTDPTSLDDNGDGQQDWVLRDRSQLDPTEIDAGIWRPKGPVPLDTFPPVNFTERTQARVRMRDLSRLASGGFSPRGLGGATFWINLDYNAAGYFPIYGSVTTLDGAAHELALFALTDTTQLLAGPLGVTENAFVVLELDFDPATKTVSSWLNGAALPTAPPPRLTTPNSDQFATLIGPQGTAEFDDAWVATCKP